MKKPLPIEKTLIIIKPDAVKRGLIGEIFEKFETTGLKLLACRMEKPNEQTIDHHYPHTKEWITEMGQKTLNSFKNLKIDPKQEFGTDDPFIIGQEIRKRLIKYWFEGPIVISVWSGPHAIYLVRKLRGHTIPIEAEPGTIHISYSFDSAFLSSRLDRVVKTFIHASGTVEEAEREIKYWFPNYEFKNYERDIDSLYLK